MLAECEIQQAMSQEAELVAEILTEAAQWLQRAGMRMWREDELSSVRISADVAGGFFFIARRLGEPAGTVKFQLEDPDFWPDVQRPDAAYVHRLAVRRRHAGTGVSTALLVWAVERARNLGRNRLRLDCEASRPRLRSFYESFGFVHHINRPVGPYFVSRYEYDVLK